MERFQTLLDLSHGLCLQKRCFSEFKWTKKISANVKKKKEFCLSYNLFAMYGIGNVILYLCRLLA